MAQVKDTIHQWDTVAVNNSPAGSDLIGTGLDDNLREIQKVVKEQFSTGTISAAVTTNLSDVNNRQVIVTGTGVTITSFGTLEAEAYKIVTFDGLNTITHNATSMIMPNGEDFTTNAGDALIMYSLGSGNWQCINVFRENGVWESPSASNRTRLLDSGDDLDNITDSGVYAFNTSAPVNAPTDVGGTAPTQAVMFVESFLNGYVHQMVWSGYVTGGGIWVRRYTTAWGPWERVILDTEVDDSPANGATTTPISSNWAYDHENDTGDPHPSSANYVSPTARTANKLTSADDLNNITTPGVYTFLGSSVPANAPSLMTYATMFVENDGSQPSQMCWGGTDGQRKIAIRRRDGGTWYAWQFILDESDVDDTPVNGATAAPISSNWAYDLLAGANAFTQLTAISAVINSRITIANNDIYDVTNGCGLTFASGPALSPCDGAGVSANNAVDIGSTGFRWKDGYFGGTVNAASVVTTGDATIGGVFIDASEGIYFEDMTHAITWNDNSGNFNIRVGNTDQSSYEKFTEAGYAMKQEWTQSSGLWECQVSTVSGVVGNTISWRTQITTDPDDVTLAYRGATKLQTTASGIALTGGITEDAYTLTGTAISMANGSIQTKTLSANTTFTESLSDGDSVYLRLINAATYTVTWPTITWTNGDTPPSLTNNCAVVLWQENSVVYGTYVGSFV